MPKEWNEISTNDLLNYKEANTGQMAQYERIMRHKSEVALMNVHAGLFDLKKTISHSSQKLEEKMKSLESTIEDSSKSQSKLQAITIALTIVIALSTCVYTWITWQTVQVQKESNRIQKSALTNIQTSNNKNTSNKAN